jgi:hypothetical protein
MRTRTVSLLLFAAVLFLASCDPKPSEPEAAPAPKPQRPHAGYFMQMPLAAASPSIDAMGGAVIKVTSNLPDGTLAYITSDLPGRGPSVWLLHRFVGGMLRLHQTLYCSEKKDIDLTRGFDIQVIVVPDISLIFKSEGSECKSLTNCGFGPLQPRSVQAVLGRNFERLTGDSVTTIIGARALVASAHYAWPKNDCRASLELAAGTPPTCPPSTTSINDDEGGANLEAVAQSIAILLRQNRICDVYSFTTERFRRANPWRDFRDRTKRWSKLSGAYAMYGATNKRGPPTVGVLESPTFLVVTYNLWSKGVASARFVAHRWRSGYTKWEIAELDLL